MIIDSMAMLGSLRL